MVKINSRMSEKRNDVLNDKRFRDAMYPLLMQLEDSKISVTELQCSFLKILKKQKSDQYFWNDRCNYCLEKKEDYIFWREDFGGKDVTVSLLFLEPGEVHPPRNPDCHLLPVLYGDLTQIVMWMPCAKLVPQCLNQTQDVLACHR